LIGGYEKELFERGVTTVAHHDLFYPFLADVTPIPTRSTRLRWAQFPLLCGRRGKSRRLLSRHRRAGPWDIHAREGLDDEDAASRAHRWLGSCRRPKTCWCWHRARPAQRARLDRDAAADFLVSLSKLACSARRGVAETRGAGQRRAGTILRLSATGGPEDELRMSICVQIKGRFLNRRTPPPANRSACR